MIYSYYLDKRSDIMKNTQFKVEDVPCDISGRENILPEQKTKPNNFGVKNLCQ